MDIPDGRMKRIIVEKASPALCTCRDICRSCRPLLLSIHCLIRPIRYPVLFLYRFLYRNPNLLQPAPDILFCCTCRKSVSVCYIRPLADLPDIFHADINPVILCRAEGNNRLSRQIIMLQKRAHRHRGNKPPDGVFFCQVWTKKKFHFFAFIISLNPTTGNCTNCYAVIT